uniref:GDSL esterase/lipase n=1 Tax=Zea mays TaxID=4577 RepID=A0A804N365_MAIZE
MAAGGAGAAVAAVLTTAVAAVLVAVLTTTVSGQDDPAPEPAPAAACARRPVVFAFGDSNTDTGGVAAGLGHYYPLPEGRVFFRRSTGRLCDGRLVIDYLSGESLNMSYLSPYLEAVGSDFTGGANFAISGSSTLPRNVPFALHVQVQQFLHLKQRSLDLAAHGGTAPVDADGFRNALYLIDIGQNDLSAAFGSGAPYDDVVHHRIPAIVLSTTTAPRTSGSTAPALWAACPRSSPRRGPTTATSTTTAASRPSTTAPTSSTVSCAPPATASGRSCAAPPSSTPTSCSSSTTSSPTTPPTGSRSRSWRAAATAGRPTTTTPT